MIFVFDRTDKILFKFIPFPVLFTEVTVVPCVPFTLTLEMNTPALKSTVNAFWVRNMFLTSLRLPRRRAGNVTPAPLVLHLGIQF